MKSYKEIVSQINEATRRLKEVQQLDEAEGGMGGARGGQVDDTADSNTITKADDGKVNLKDFQNPEVVDRLNAAMHTINMKDVIDPATRVVEIKTALAHAGVDFDVRDVEIAVGESTVPATLFGGMMGMEDNGQFVNDDGFTRKTGQPYGIKFEWTKDHGVWSLQSEIAPM
jgi:hypothetical protein